jgi:hypothetical protein
MNMNETAPFVNRTLLADRCEVKYRGASAEKRTSAMAGRASLSRPLDATTTSLMPRVSTDLHAFHPTTRNERLCFEQYADVGSKPVYEPECRNAPPTHGASQPPGVRSGPICE